MTCCYYDDDDDGVCGYRIIHVATETGTDCDIPMVARWMLTILTLLLGDDCAVCDVVDCERGGFCCDYDGAETPILVTGAGDGQNADYGEYACG